MITITRRLALQLRSVMRRAFGNFRGTGPQIGFIAGKEGLTAKSMLGDVAVEYREQGERTPETIWLPFEVPGRCRRKERRTCRFGSNRQPGQRAVVYR